MKAKVFSLLLIVNVLIFACLTTPTPEPEPPFVPIATIEEPIPPAEEPIGSATAIQTLVELAHLGEVLNALDGTAPMFNGDAFRVTQRGESLLDFGDNVRLRLFNDTSAGDVRAESAPGTPLDVSLYLEFGGFTGEVVEEGASATIRTPGNSTITVYGTQFFVAYDPASASTIAGNFEGKMDIESGGVRLQIPSGSYRQAQPSNAPQVEIQFTLDQPGFEQLARDMVSGLDAAKSLGSAPEEPLTCSDVLGCVDIAPGDPIHIAYLLALSGSRERDGQESLRSIEIALDDRGWELLGHPISLTGEDGQCNAEIALQAGQSLAADASILGVIGPICNPVARVTIPTISNAGMVMVSPATTNPTLNEATANFVQGYLRTAASDKEQATLAARFLVEFMGVSRAASIGGSSAAGQILQAEFSRAFQELGGTLVADTTIPPDATEMRALLLALADEGTQAIFFTLTGPQASIFLNQARNDSGMDNATLISPDYLFDQNFAESTGFAANNLYLTGQYLNTDTQEMQAFLEKWRAKYGDQPVTSFYAQSYDAAHLLLNAIETIAMQDQSGRMLIGRQALRNALYSTRDFRGLTGTLACTPNGDCGSAQTLAVYTVVYELLDPEAGFTLSWPPHMYWLP